VIDLIALLEAAPGFEPGSAFIIHQCLQSLTILSCYLEGPHQAPTHHAKTIGLIALPVLLGGCGDNLSHNAKDHHPTELVMLGDSLTWLPAYSSQVADTYEDGKAIVYAFGGFATGDFLPGGDVYMGGEFSMLRPRVVTILLGTNDAIQEITPRDFGDNLSKIVNALLEDGSGTIILVVPPPIFFLLGRAPAANLLLNHYRQEIEWLCGVPDDAIECGPDLFDVIKREHVFDGIHFNDEGGDIVAGLLLDELDEYRSANR